MKKKILAFGSLAAILCIIDRLTKKAAATYLKEEPIDIGRLFRLSYVENNGVAFGMMSGNTAFAIILTSVILMALIGWLLFSKKEIALLAQIGLWSVIAGGIGNLYDRIFYAGNVTDFVEPVFIRFAVFNFADICVTCGALLAAAGLLFVKGKETK